MAVDTDLKRRLQDSFRWRGDRTDPHSSADVTGWWRDPDVLRSLGPGLASLFDDAQPSVLLRIQSRGTLLGALVAAHLGVGLAEVWIGAAVVVDGLERTPLRRTLRLRSLLSLREL